MYQIIYIDIDEEITATIDKLRKSKTKQVFLAIPKRALILQSIVSLKLLAREAEKLEKSIIVATQDPREQKMAEKAGIETRASLEGLDTEGEMKENIVPRIQESEPLGKRPAAPNSRSRKNIEEIGSDGFYDVNGPSQAAVLKTAAIASKAEDAGVAKRSMSEISREEKKERSVGGSYFDRQSGAQNNLEEAWMAGSSFSENRSKDDLLRNFFEEDGEKRRAADVPKVKAKSAHQPVSGRIKKTLAIIFVAGILVAGSALGYLFVPKADVLLKTRTKTVEKDLDLRADVNQTAVDPSSLSVPAKIVEKEETYTFSYPVTGKGKTQGQKAKGTVVIYNEYSSSPQPLVATTRLETPDKKIFRLTKGVTVPGTTEVDGKKQPGAIEAEVIADASGEEYNIDPSSFTIPGFAGGPKFEKFYAKSSEKMKGGNSTKESAEISALTQTDLAMAKGKSESQAQEKIKEDLKNSLDGEMFLSESAIENTIIESVALSKLGDQVGEFQYRVKIKARAFVFSDADVKMVFQDSFQASDQSPISLDYGAVNADLSAGTATIKVRGEVSHGAEVDIEKLKNDLAGKNGAEIEELIKNYPQIAEIEINVQPAFLFKKVPQMTSRIEVLVE